MAYYYRFFPNGTADNQKRVGQPSELPVGTLLRAITDVARGYVNTGIQWKEISDDEFFDRLGEINYE